MSIQDFLSQQDASRKSLLLQIHEIIIKTDKKVTAEVGSMMGKEMILYTCGGHFKYGLSSVKNYMSLHVMPMYGSPIFGKYKAILPKANFQKGCINFRDKEEMPVKYVLELINDCAKIDWAALVEKYKSMKQTARPKSSK